MQIRGSNVVITGGSQGIGERLAEAFAKAGGNVLVVARSEDKLRAVAERIGGDHLVADLTNADQVDGLVQACVERMGHVDIWVNNAGVETEEAFVNVSVPDLRRLARLNFEAPLVLTRNAARHMLDRGQGHIVQLSSVAGAIPFPGLTAYAGSKAGITHFTESLRVELARTNVGLTVVAPGPVDTDMWDRLDQPELYPAKALKRFRQLQFLPKVKPEKIADATVKAVENNKRHVRVPARFNGYHLLNNSPRRMLEAAMVGIDMTPNVEADATTDVAAVEAAIEKIWPTDNPMSRRWPLYTRGNVGEVFPEVVLPLTWDVYGQAAEDGWRAAFETMGLLMPGDLAANEPMTILGVFGGYCYINASYVRMLGVRAPGGTVEVIDQQFFGESDAPAYAPRKGDKNVRSSAKLGKTVFRLLGTTDLPQLEDDKARVRDYMAAYPGDDADDAALIAHFRNITPLFQQLFQRHIENTFSVALVLGALSDLCIKVGREADLVSLLGGIGDVESSAPSDAMWKLARMANETPAVGAAFDAGIEGLADRLRSSADAAAWVTEFDAFLDEFGSRGPNEWDIGSDPWALRPELALAAIGRIRNAPDTHNPQAQAERLAGERAEAIARVRGALNPVDKKMFDKAHAATTIWSQARERSKTTIIRAVHSARVAQTELARRVAERGGPAERRHTCFVSVDDFEAMLANPTGFNDVIAERATTYADLSQRVPPFILEGEVPAVETWALRGDTAEALEAGTTVQGIAGCPGVARGRARVVLDAGDPGALEPGEILVAPITDPSWTPLFLAASGVIVDVGATMSHAVIVSRELGIPCVVSAVGATDRIPDGALVELDGNTGEVTIIELP
jgi:pyruvate,water dikinase